MPDADLTDRLHALLADLSDSLAGLAADWEEAREHGRDAVLLFLDLGLLLQRAGAPGGAPSTQVSEFAIATAPAVERGHEALVMVAHDTESALFETFEVEDQWISVCERRSGLEFLVDTYRGIPAADVQRLLQDSLEEILRHRCASEGFLEPSSIPEAMPESHWWWWCPSRP